MDLSVAAKKLIASHFKFPWSKIVSRAVNFVEKLEFPHLKKNLVQDEWVISRVFPMKNWKTKQRCYMN